jgi:hypothetical protein
MIDISKMDHAKAAWILRILEQQGSKRQAEMRALCERAAETAPPEEVKLWQRRLKVYRAGRIVQWKTFPVTIIEPVDPEMVAEIENAFEEFEGE